jgi:hypothetical protein
MWICKIIYHIMKSTCLSGIYENGNQLLLFSAKIWVVVLLLLFQFLCIYFSNIDVHIFSLIHHSFWNLTLLPWAVFFRNDPQEFKAHSFLILSFYSPEQTHLNFYVLSNVRLVGIKIQCFSIITYKFPIRYC